MHHVVLIHAGAVGDFVLALRVVAGVRACGARDVTVLGRPAIAGVALMGGGVNKVLDVEAGGYHALFTHDAEIPESVRLGLAGADTVIDMLGGAGSPLSARLKELGISRIIGIDPRPRPQWGGHITEQWLTDLREAGIPVNPGPPRLDVDEGSRRQALARLCPEGPTPGRRMIILHPGSGGPHKRWPAASYLALNERLHGEGCVTRFLLGPVELECMKGEEIERFRAGGPTLEGLTLKEAAACLACAGTFVGNDSGLSHLAAAVGTRTIALFGPTAPERWCPLGDHVTVLRGEPPEAWPDIVTVERSIVPRA